MIPRDTIDRIFETARIEEVVGEFVTLKRSGANFVACCPFHNEKTPSFHVNPSKGIYKCFGCGKAGNVATFLKEHEGMSFEEAMRWLGKKYGIEIVERELTAEDIAAGQKKESLYLVSEFAGKFFQDSLKTGEGKSVGYAYFRSRGLEDSSIMKYGLGWAPKRRNALAEAARAAGYKEEYLVDSGLCLRNDDGSLSDRFYDRVMFPIHSASGRIIGFGGRTLKSGHPAMKYVNTPTTEIYSKERSLYGLWFAHSEISRKDKCYLVEGYLDVLSMHQLGIQNVVASSGTSLTLQQVRMIKKYTQNITIMYDGDPAGVKAALRGIGLVIKEGLNVKVLLLPDGDDPDSYARKHSLQEVEDFIAAREQDFISFKTSMLLDDAGNDPLKKAELINDIADTIALIPDPVKRAVYAQASSERFQVDSAIIFGRITQAREKLLKEDKRAELRQKRLSEGAPSSGDSPILEEVQPSSDTGNTRLENIFLAPSERELLGFILNNGLCPLEFPAESDYYEEELSSVADFIRDALEVDACEFSNSFYRRIYNAYFELYDSDPDITQDEILRKLISVEDQDLAEGVLQLTQDKYLLSVKNFKDSMTKTSTLLVKYVPKAIMVYQSKRLQQRSRELTEELKSTGDPQKTADLLAGIKQVSAYRKIFDEKLGRVQ